MSKNYTQTGIGQSTEFGKAGSRVATNPLAPSGQRIEMRQNDDVTPSRTSGAPAVEPDDYITFAQFEAQSKWIDPVRALADANVASLSGTTTIDGVGLVDGDRAALTAQTNPVENGVWIVRAGAWERPLDFDTGDSGSDRTWLVAEGATYENWRWQVSTDPPSDIIDTDPLTIIPTNMGTAGVTSLSSVGTGTRLFATPDPRQGMIDISSVAEGNGIQIGGTPGVTELTVTAEILGSAVAGTVDAIQSNPVGGASRLRDFVDTGSVTWTVNGDGNLEAVATPATAGLPYDTIYYVSLTGSAAATNGGLDVNEPTDLVTAIANANAAGNATIALLDQGTYTTGGAITITGDNVSIVSFFNQSLTGPLPVQISDAVTISATGFSAKGIGFTSTLDVSAAPANFTGCAFGGAVTVSDLASGSFGFDDCSFSDDLTISGVASGFSQVQVTNCSSFGGTFTASHSGAGTVNWVFAGCYALQSPIALAQSATGTTSLLLYQCALVPAVSVTASNTGIYSIGYRGVSEAGTLTLNHTASGDHVVNIEDTELDGVTATAVAGTLAFRMYSSRTSGNLDLSSGNGSIALQSSVIGAAGNGGLLIAAGYNWETSDTSFTTAPPTSLLGTEVTANNDPGANITSDFSSVRIEAQPFGGDPSTTNFDLLYRDPTPSRGFVRSVSSTAFQKALSAGPGIDATALAANPATVQTQDPKNGTLAGVKRVLVVTFSGQGNGTVTVGTLPDDARVVRSAVRIDSAATAGNLNLGYSGGTGTELQDGSVANDVTNADTYNVLDSISNAGGGAQTVEADFTGMTGTASGEIEVEFYVLA